MKIFLDTNIVIDLLDVSRKSSEDSLQLLELAMLEKMELAISEDILTTVYYVMQKNIPRKKLLAFLEMLNEEFAILNFGRVGIKKSIKLCQKNSKLDFEDVSQAVCAEKHKCDMIITNDKNFPKLKVSVKTGEEFIGDFKKQG